MSDPQRETEEFAKARKRRNLVLGLGLVAFIVIVYVVTLVQMGGAIVNRPL